MKAIYALVTCLLISSGAGLFAAEAQNNPSSLTRVPDGPPPRLLEFIVDLRKQMPPPSRESLPRRKQIASAMIETAEKVMTQVKPDHESFLAAVKVKCDAFDELGVGDRNASAARLAWTKTLINNPSPAVAYEGRLRLLNAELLEMHWTGDTQSRSVLIDHAAKLLAAKPDDDLAAFRIVKWAGALEYVPNGGAGLAVSAYERLAPMLAKSGNPEIIKKADLLEGKRLRLTLSGKPVEITGTLLDGSTFDLSQFRGKVVIVDFWATWCGPCMVDITALQKLHASHQKKGLEVVLVSLDDDANAVQAFVAKTKTSWPILFAGASEKFEHPMATRYGVTSIPWKLLVRRDGTLETTGRDAEGLAAAVEALLNK